MPTYPIPAASTWFSNALITAALIQANITDYLSDLHGSADGYIGEATSASTLTLSTTSDFAGLATVTFTLAEQRRVKITTMAAFNNATAVTGRYRCQSGYNSGSSATIGSVTKVGQVFIIPEDSSVANFQSGNAVGTVLLAAGTYTAYAAVTRATGGAATDTVSSFYTLVEDIGAV